MAWSPRISTVLIVAASAVFCGAGHAISQEAPALLSAASAVRMGADPGPAPIPDGLIPSAIPDFRGPSSWGCADDARLDVMPVSYDASAEGGPAAWVVAYYYRNELVASERVSKAEARSLLSERCADGRLAHTSGRISR
ncbi:MAG: hypothetical protein R3C52_09630 [Hyphomonadaceae bacterium]